jgi:cytochrome c553
VLGPSLIGVGAASVHFQVGTGRMPMARNDVQAPRKKVAYDEEQTAALAAYVASLAPGPAIPESDQYDPAQGDIARGGLLYRTNCAQCHNTTGQGGALTLGKYAPSSHRRRACAHLLGHAHRAAEHAGVQRRRCCPARTSATSSPTSRTSRANRTQVGSGSAASDR